MQNIPDMSSNVNPNLLIISIRNVQKNMFAYTSALGTKSCLTKVFSFNSVACFISIQHTILLGVRTAQHSLFFSLPGVHESTAIVICRGGNKSISDYKQHVLQLLTAHRSLFKQESSDRERPYGKSRGPPYFPNCKGG